ncbi:LolA family protein [Ferviditalea candida]|uniref:Outer membrane lipoprotein carrier protein LolA n=1 Tax=Ferviditalea candida TaxID=3108399 RepID=A0ABU5ZMN5_9BACL|nr:outer membrane lipoprotein carrier protein LolA [Paenibacillaceae bacterium T2]
MRRVMGIAAVMLIGIALLAGCGGKKDANSVVKELDQNVTKMESYKGEGTMVLHTGQQPLKYNVEVWYQNPHYYRVALTNEAKDVTQIVLRNDEGVFVLTPHLNKSFRFQSDWPEKQGQVYLYQSLAKSIVNDTNRQFAAENKAYVFDVAANYQNSSLVRQKIWLDKNNYAPQRVEVSDPDGNVLVEVSFDSFKFNANFEKDSFDMQRNMTASNLQSMAAMVPADGGSGKAAGDQSQATAQANTKTNSQASSQSSSSKNQGFGVIEPAYTPMGVALKDMKDLKLGDQAGVMLRYEGNYHYSLMEARPEAQTVTAMNGNIVDLGERIGVLLGDQMKTLAWTTGGVEFRLTSGDLPVSEMVNIAKSVEGQIGK